MLQYKTTTIFLLLVCLMLSLFLYKNWKTGEHYTIIDKSVKNTAPQIEEIVIAQPPALENVSVFNDITDRTLFSPERQYQKPQAEKSTPKKEAPKAVVNPGFELIGTYIGKYERVALIKIKSTGKVHSVVEDGKVEGWILYKLTENTAKLESGKQTIELKMQQEKPPTPNMQENTIMKPHNK